MKKNKEKSVISKVWSAISKYKFLLILSLLLALITVALTLYVPILIGDAIDYIVAGNVNFDKIGVILLNVDIVH